MVSYLIFPETAWTESSLGFSGISFLENQLKGIGLDIKCRNEYQAIVFIIDNINEYAIRIVQENLPNNFSIPVILKGTCFILNKKTLRKCECEDADFKKLMDDAHLVIKERISEELPNLSYQEIDQLINEFSQTTFKFKPVEINIEKIVKHINIEKEHENRLIHVLVDIKSIWYAMEYDFIQLANYVSETSNHRFKRYVYINNIITRIRSLWEKLIALAILLELPTQFDNILGARRVRTRFIRMFKDNNNPIIKKIWDGIHSLEIFEQKYRTPELHKIGRTIWWASKVKLDQEVNRLIFHRNILNRILREIMELIFS